MNLAQYAEYISASLAKGTIGSQISVGIFALIGVCAVLGAYFGATRGFSKSVIRLFTVGASLVCSLLLVKTISKVIVSKATVSGSDNTVEGLLSSYFPGFVDSVPEMIKPLLSEMDAGTATIFIMMLVAIILTPILFILFFYILRFATFFLYELLAGLAGVISYGKSIASMIGGGCIGLLQGVLIASVVIIPISGLCNVADEAREPLIGQSEEPNAYIELAYDSVIDDLADNPVFDLVDKFGGSVAYKTMITVNINDEAKDMGDECVGAVKVLSNLIPFINSDSGFDWKHPSDTHRQALEGTVEDLGDNDLLASLISDVIRGAAKSAQNGSIPINLSGAAKTLIDDLMVMFSTTTKDTIAGDLDVIVDVYFIMSDRKMFDTLTSGDPEAVRHLLIDKDESGETAVDALLNRLNAYERSHPIVTSLTKLSFAMMQDAMGFDSDTTEIYENVKDGMKDVLNHNKSDYATEEEYKAEVSKDLDKVLADNELNVDEDTKQIMVDYIADNYGDHEGEITDKEINDALLSYYKAYADALAKGEQPPLPDGSLPEGTVPEGGEG